MFCQLKTTNQDLFKQVLTTKAGYIFHLKTFSEVNQTTSQHGGIHSYLVEERICFAKLINDILKDD